MRIVMFILEKLRRQIILIIDFFYKPFERYIPEDTFRYAFCGGTNMVFDFILYYISFNFILFKQNLNLIFVTISPHIAAFLMAFSISFPTGFLLSKYISFPQSYLKGRIQLFRYSITVAICFLLNYVLLKLFVEYIGLYAIISKILTTFIVVIFSYFSQKYFTFRSSRSILSITETDEIAEN